MRFIFAYLILVGLSIIVGLVVAVGSFLSTVTDEGWTSSTLSACPSEDSDNCYWDATEHGNGLGTSFVTIDNHTYLLGE